MTKMTYSLPALVKKKKVSMQRKPIVLLILDGWGCTENLKHNAIAAARKPQWEDWWQHQPHIEIEASGLAVGLPPNQMGNSEVGHMHIGAGRIIPQDFTRINQSINNGEFFNNFELLKLIQTVKKKGKYLHIMGLLSEGGVHSHEHHLYAFLQLCEQHEFSNIYLHIFLDGRDTPPKSAKANIAKLTQYLQQHPVAKIASLMGRYYAMDRDMRWDRTHKAYNLLTIGETLHHFSDPIHAIDHFYQENITDEFIPPTQINSDGIIHDGDSIFFFNFRSDRARQLTRCFVEKNFNAFERQKIVALQQFVTMTEYSKALSTTIAFPPIKLTHTLGEVIANHGLKQLRIAETEKYAHVTFFLNGGNEATYPHEERILIPSPKVATYDLQPQMSADLIAKTIVEALTTRKYDVIICNFANADMVGHTGDFEATVSAIECLDHAMQQIGEAVEAAEGKLLITADHGNAEIMYDEETNQAHTAHTHQPVPLLFVGKGYHFEQTTGSLVDIAPTLLHLLNIKVPKEMTGNPLLVKNHAQN